MYDNIRRLQANVLFYINTSEALQNMIQAPCKFLKNFLTSLYLNSALLPRSTGIRTYIFIRSYCLTLLHPIQINCFRISQPVIIVAVLWIRIRIRIRIFLPVRIRNNHFGPRSVRIRNKLEWQMSSQTQYKIEDLVSLITIFFHLH